MALLTAAKKLFVPGKNDPDAHKQYGKDMRVLEIFNPINKLVAGSGVTLTPADGTGPQVEIAASGGGGGAAAAMFYLGAGPDTSAFPVPISPGMSTAAYPGTFFDNFWPLFTNNSGGVQQFPVGSTWMVIVAGGVSINTLPQIIIPPYTSVSNIQVNLTYYALDFAFTNFAAYGLRHTFPAGTFAAPTSFTFASTDAAVYFGPVGDPSLDPALGIISGAGFIPYMCGVDGYVATATGTVFT